MSRFRAEEGQAATEYVVALTLVVIILVAIGGLVNYYRSSGQDSRPVARTLQEAPYTLGGLQGVCDVLIH
ncbi:MAG: hypothetical protein FWC48_00050 [Actinomycetia bacterium]|nr:hypothetical protein [Actinomycetes bacterium]